MQCASSTTRSATRSATGFSLPLMNSSFASRSGEMKTTPAVPALISCTSQRLLVINHQQITYAVFTLLMLHWITLLHEFLIVAGEKAQRCCYFTVVVCCQLYTMSMSIVFFSTKSWSVTAVLYSGYLQKFVILKFCQLQTSIIFIVWTCLLARSDAVSGKYLRTV